LSVIGGLLNCALGRAFIWPMKNTIAVSSWSIHRLIGTSVVNGPGFREPFAVEDTWGNGELTIMDVPAALAARGYMACEICHFHIAALEPGYLNTLRAAFASAGVSIQTLLIDDGDITSPDPAIRARDIAWIKTWIDAASVLGATHARVIAGQQKPAPEALALSVRALRDLLAYGNARGVAVVTENWLDLTATPAEVHHILDRVPGLGFMCDTGNWVGASKYADLTSIFARANLCHAKAEVGAGYAVNAADFDQCLAAAKATRYAGPMTLIFHDDGDEWRGLEAERQCVLRA
jgi:sugar phosphate isomerase/epimerase